MIPISAQLLQQIIIYLQTKPWLEVNPIIAALVQAAQRHEDEKNSNITG